MSDIKKLIEELKALEAKIIPLSRDRNQPMAGLTTKAEVERGVLAEYIADGCPPGDGKNAWPACPDIHPGICSDC